MNIMFPILLILSVSFFHTVYYNKNSLNLIPITIFTITLILYSFYIFNLLTIGFYLIVITSTILWILSIIKLWKKRNCIKEVLIKFFSPGLIAFLLVIFVINFVVYDNFVALWDELRLWGAYPKILFYNNGTLQLGNNVLLSQSMQHYFPGMPLFQYFFVKSCGTFKESYLFLSYSIIGISLFMPFLNNISWKKAYICLALILAAFLLPLCYGNSPTISDGLSYYYTLYINPILGIMFGYSVYLSINNVFKNKFCLFNFCITLCFMILLKNTAILFAIVSICSAIICEIFIYKNKKKFLLLIPILVVILIFVSWNVLINILNVKIYHVDNIDIKSIFNLIVHPTSEQIYIIKDFINYGIKIPLVETIIKIPNIFTTFFSFLIFYALLLYTIYRTTKLKKFKIGIISIFVGCFLFMVGLLMLYLFDLNVVVCYVRYTNTIMFSLLIFTAFIIFELLFQKQNNKIVLVSFLFLLYICCVFPIYKPIKFHKIYNDFENDSNEMFSLIEEETKDKEGKYKILCIMDNNKNDWNVIYNHHLYFKSIGRNFLVANNVMYNINTDSNESAFLNFYTNNFDYIFILSLNDDLPLWFKEMFATKPMAHSLYQAIFNNGRIEFEIVSNNEVIGNE